MSLAEEARAHASRPGPRCAVCRYLEDPTIGPELAEALADDSLYGSAIGAALRGRGYPVGDQTVTRHRGGGCLDTR